jgi:hypothetical protein
MFPYTISFQKKIKIDFLSASSIPILLISFRDTLEKQGVSEIMIGKDYISFKNNLFSQNRWSIFALVNKGSIEIERSVKFFIIKYEFSTLPLFMFGLLTGIITEFFTKNLLLSLETTFVFLLLNWFIACWRNYHFISKIISNAK